ncbi:MAG: cell division protein ZapA [Betaproteobacteria bacterium]|jgi:cell division protein ZapA|nr:cell division protein ZapA [Betaproteobacteria bacterium]NBP44502.1 cell division protein ZapA [Betaproteobacteria bacterium]
MKQLEVQIMGQGYVLSCPVGAEQRLNDAVHKVDEAMCRIRDNGKIKARDRIAVLAAVNLAFEQVNAAMPLDLSSGEFDTNAYDRILARLDDALADDGRLL